MIAPLFGGNVNFLCLLSRLPPSDGGGERPLWLRSWWCWLVVVVHGSPDGDSDPLTCGLGGSVTQLFGFATRCRGFA